MLERCKSEDELAGVLAHEIAHDAFGHAARTVTRQMFWMTKVKKINSPAEVEAALQRLLAEYEKKPIAALGESLLGFARFDELEADRAAFYNTYKAGYNPAALAALLKRVDREDKDESRSEYHWRQVLMFLFGSHPPTPQRSLAMEWESNFVIMPPRDAYWKSAAFDDMKAQIETSRKN
jgi:predicted Zn-dependent protease